MKNETTNHLQERYPNAFLLLSQMARRTRLTDDEITGLRRGECFIGDHRKAGLTMKEYRNAKNVLEKLGFAAFKGTNKGTIGTITNSDVYDVFRNLDGKQVGNQRASQGQSKGNQRATNENEEKEQNERMIEKDLPGNLNDHPVQKPKKEKLNFLGYLKAQIIEKDLEFIQEDLIKFYEYRMQKQAAKRYQTPHGIDGLLSDIQKCINLNYNPFKCLMVAMQRQWQTPDPGYFENLEGFGKRNGKPVVNQSPKILKLTKEQIDKKLADALS